MFLRVVGPLVSRRGAALLAQAVRRADTGILDHAVDLDALRLALEQAATPLVEPMKVSPHTALDRIRGTAWGHVAGFVARCGPPHPNG